MQNKSATTVSLPPSREMIRAYMRAGLTGDQAKAIKQEHDAEDLPAAVAGSSRVMRDGLQMRVVDPAQLEALLEIARLSLVLLDYTEVGGGCCVQALPVCLVGGEPASPRHSASIRARDGQCGW